MTLKFAKEKQQRFMEQQAKHLASKSSSLKFSPQSWWADTRTLSLQAKALWFEILLRMHVSPRRGYLLNQDMSKVSATQLATGLGTTQETVIELCRELESAGVFSRNNEKVVFSRRMVREQAKIEKELAEAKVEDDKTKLDQILKLARERGVDTAKEMNKIQCYLLAHPDKKYSVRFVTNWMGKAETTLMPAGYIKKADTANSHCASPPSNATPWGEVSMTEGEWVKAGKPSLTDLILEKRKKEKIT